MKNFLIFLPVCIFLFFDAQAQHKTENIIIVTLDGMRWQEVFGGADEALINDSVFVRDKEALRKKFWAVSAEERRMKLCLNSLTRKKDTPAKLPFLAPGMSSLIF